jgi:hypothetical protein
VYSKRIRVTELTLCKATPPLGGPQSIVERNHGILVSAAIGSLPLLAFDHIDSLAIHKAFGEKRHMPCKSVFRKPWTSVLTEASVGNISPDSSFRVAVRG